MTKLSRLILMMSIVATSATMSLAYGEAAPVYDADTMQQQFDNSNKEAAQDYPPPPAPAAQDNDGFVPVQSMAPSTTTSSPTSEPGVSTSISPAPGTATPETTPGASTPETAEQLTATTENASLSTAERLARLEQQVKTLQTSGASARIESLQAEVQNLRGQVEQLTHQVQQLQNQQKTLSSNLDKNLSQDNRKIAVNDVNMNTDDVITSSPSSVTKPHKDKSWQKKTNLADATTDTVKSVGPQPNVAEEQQIYQTAYNLIKTKKYNEAVNTLQKMLQKYPTGQFAANAHYWLGELYGLLNKHDEALNEFSTVVKTYPESPRVSDAQLKVGLIYASQMNWPEARGAFKKVINHYPGTTSARLAQEQLKEIKQAGH